MAPNLLVFARVVCWIVPPSTTGTDPLLAQEPPWNVLFIYYRTTDVDSPTASAFRETKEQLLHHTSRPALTGALGRPLIAESAQNPELTGELSKWIKEWDPEDTKGAVSMLEFSKFREGMRAEYLKYREAFVESIGSRSGGVVELVGEVKGDEGSKAGKWDEIALVHYSSTRHFADMVASEDFQEVNREHRLSSLEDTCILCIMIREEGGIVALISVLSSTPYEGSGELGIRARIN